MNRFNIIQKIYSNLRFFTEETEEYGNSKLFNLFDDLDSILDNKECAELEKMHKRLNELIEIAQQIIENESKAYLKERL